MQTLLLAVTAALALVSSLASAQVDSNMPEQGPISVAQVPVNVQAAAVEALPGFLLYKASFRWMDDDGTFILEGRYQGEDVRVWVTGEGEIRYTGVISE